MLERKIKQDKNKKVQIIKRFLNGENVVDDILDDSEEVSFRWIRVINKETFSMLTEEQRQELNLIEDLRAREVKCKEMFTASNILFFPPWTAGARPVFWHEKKNYPD